MKNKQLLMILVFLVLFLPILSLLSLNNQTSINHNGITVNSSKAALKASAWVGNGTVISTAGYDQQYPSISSDGSGGAVIVWEDYRSGSTWDIYAQRISSAGTCQWTSNGVAICTASYDQVRPKICSDGSGGAIMTWVDVRSGTYSDIYARRVNAAGTPQWTANGVAMCTATDDQFTPVICSDGSGGAIITWVDRRNLWSTMDDIYAQRVNAAGTPQWTANGIVICTAKTYQASPQIISNGTGGGAIIVWEDPRNINNYDIYAQRINAAGAIQWNINGTSICPAPKDQESPQLCSDGAGGAIITWQDNRSSNWDIYTQWINAAGVLQWAVNGTAICTASGTQESPQICSDGAGGAIIVWEDYRSGFCDVYAQWINAAGTPQWTANGVAICTTMDSKYFPLPCSDGMGGAIITWQNYHSGWRDIYAQRISSTGTLQWATNGVAICRARYDQYYPALCSDGSNGAIICWEDSRSGTYSDIYALHTDNIPPASFSIQWVDNQNPTNWITNQTPSVVGKFYEETCGIKISTVQYAYSTVGFSTPTNWASVNGVYLDSYCTKPAGDGASGWLYARVNAVNFGQDSASLNTIRFRANDTSNNRGNQTTASIIKIDSSIGYPCNLTSLPNGWTNFNYFYIYWENPSDLTGIAGAYYKLDSPPSSNSDGYYVAGTNITSIGLSVSSEGAHNVYIWLKDLAGNVDFHKYNTTTLYYRTTRPIPFSSFPIIIVIGAGVAVLFYYQKFRTILRKEE